ncbi:unnamed protein product, partial [Laminaria digitata]
SLRQIAGDWSYPAVVIFDVVALERTITGQTVLHDQLFPMLEDETSMKVVHDVTNTTIALRRQFGTTVKVGCLLDTQLAFEILNGDLRSDVLMSECTAFSREQNVSRGGHVAFHEDTTKRRWDDMLGVRAVAIRGTSSFCHVHMISRETNCAHDALLPCSFLRMNFAMSTMDSSRLVTFRNHGSCWGGGVGREMVSDELQQVSSVTVTRIRGWGILRNAKCCTPSFQHVLVEYLFPARHGPRYPMTRSESGQTQPAEEVSEEETTAEDGNCPLEVLRLVPKVFRKEHLSKRQPKNLQDLQEIVLDEGRRPKALLHGRGRIFLCSDESRVVAAKHIKKVVGPLLQEGRFGDDNRAGFPGQLHRVSVLRGRKVNQIFGVTLRIGRFFQGSAALIDDLLFRVVHSPDRPQRAASILVLGEPGSGKTTVIRDICRRVSASQTVVIVDTSNEIAGDGSIPHLDAIGDSRRIMVPHRADQHRVMTEALQNHTPQTIVVDEISNNKEARACLDIKARGVRLIASAHGDFQSLARNPELNTVLGGTKSVTVGDQMAQANGGQKVQTQRAGAPVFDAIVEVKCGKAATWSIIRNVGVAVDALLSGDSYEVERRTRI